LADSNAGFSAGSIYHGFKAVRVVDLPGLRAQAREFQHVNTGARLLHLATEDTENLFSITFPTPPPDDTGLPHILEHAVLGGSKKFSVREPFFEMVKMSMATFINAMTSQAFTVYPISTNVKKDFFNLAEVYVDAVYFPELTEATFRREGHHLTLEDNNDLTSALKVSGIVYNEMKGAYSSPESLMYELASRGLYPDTLLGRDSGGDPDVIPDLTYEQFKDFHRRLYHPSNSLILIYGDIPTNDHLAFLAPTLDRFEATPAQIATPHQPRWKTPRTVHKTYPIGPTEDESARTFITINWLIGSALDPAEVTAWSVLERILLGNEAAPLKKAIIDSKLGADVFFAGMFGAAYEFEFHVGIKGTEVSSVEAFEALIRKTLDTLSRETFETDRVESAFQQLAYSTLEVSSQYPMRLLGLVNDAWPFGQDPLTFLTQREDLDACRQRWLSDPAMFNRLITERILDNAHRSTVVLSPSRTLQDENDRAFAQKMAERRARFSTAEIHKIARDAAELQASQGIPNTPEQLARLPQLRASDLPKAPRHIPTTRLRSLGFNLLRNDVFSNGVNYLEIDIDLAGLRPELYADLPRFTEAVNKMGVVGQSYAQLAERRAACTGGLSCGVHVTRHASDPGQSLRRVRFGLKTLDGQIDPALKLLEDVIFSVDPRDKPRLADVLQQTRAAYRTSLVNDGSSTARRQAARGHSREAAIEHLFTSPDALRRIEALVNGLDNEADRLIHSIEQIRDHLQNRRRWTISFTGSDNAFKSVERSLETWASRISDAAYADLPFAFVPSAPVLREALAGPMKVAHCAKVMPAPHLSEAGVPLFSLGVYLARFDLLLPEIRFKGNAYGANAGFDDGAGVFVLSSFRDPNIVETLDVFDRMGDWIDAAHWSQIDIDRAIIGSAKGVERPIRPGEATSLALSRHIRGDTDAFRERRYETALSGTPRSVKEAMQNVFARYENRATVCVVSSREKLDQANARLGERALPVADILP